MRKQHHYARAYIPSFTAWSRLTAHGIHMQQELTPSRNSRRTSGILAWPHGGRCLVNENASPHNMLFSLRCRQPEHLKYAEISSYTLAARDGDINIFTYLSSEWRIFRLIRFRADRDDVDSDAQARNSGGVMTIKRYRRRYEGCMPRSVLGAIRKIYWWRPSFADCIMSGNDFMARRRRATSSAEQYSFFHEICCFYTLASYYQHFKAVSIKSRDIPDAIEQLGGECCSQHSNARSAYDAQLLRSTHLRMPELLHW